MATANRYDEHAERLDELEQLSRCITETAGELDEWRDKRRQLMVELRGLVPVEVIAAAAGVTREHAHRLMRDRTREV